MNKLIILGLPKTTKEKELYSLFTTYGQVVSCDLVMDKETETSKGFGFVEFESEVSAEAAIRELHGSKVGKNKIRVKIAE